MIKINIYNDPVIKGLLTRIPEDERGLFSVLTGLLLLYLLKSALGIDLVPGFSLGIWGWFKDVFL